MAKDTSDQPFFNVPFRFGNLVKRPYCLPSFFVFIYHLLVLVEASRPNSEFGRFELELFLPPFIVECPLNTFCRCSYSGCFANAVKRKTNGGSCQPKVGSSSNPQAAETANKVVVKVESPQGPPLGGKRARSTSVEALKVFSEGDSGKSFSEEG